MGDGICNVHVIKLILLLKNPNISFQVFLYLANVFFAVVKIV
jgi:hypothetical protein